MAQHQDVQEWVKHMVNCFQTNLPMKCKPSQRQTTTTECNDFSYLKRHLTLQSQSLGYFITPADDSQDSCWMTVHWIALNTQTCMSVPALAAKYRISPSNTELPCKLHWMWSKGTVIKSTSRIYFLSVAHRTPVVLLRFSLTQQNRVISFCLDS